MPPQIIITEVAQIDQIYSYLAKRYVLLCNKAQIDDDIKPTKKTHKTKV